MMPPTPQKTKWFTRVSLESQECLQKSLQISNMNRNSPFLFHMSSTGIQEAHSHDRQGASWSFDETVDWMVSSSPQGCLAFLTGWSFQVTVQAAGLWRSVPRNSNQVTSSVSIGQSSQRVQVWRRGVALGSSTVHDHIKVWTKTSTLLSHLQTTPQSHHVSAELNLRI